jgi:hypothetical protein
LPHISAAVEAYGTNDADFKFRGIDFRFVLSHGLFSSAGIDRGTRFLLKALSKQWDEDVRKGLPLPRTVLDSGCGIGVLGICAARALTVLDPAGKAPRVRAQDRDELARVFTEFNARKNGVPSPVLEAHAEPLLAGPPGWDLILSNIPAKAGNPVLSDFISRSAVLLSPGGRGMIVVVNPLVPLFRAGFAQEAVPVLYEEAETEHTVFTYGPPARRTGFFPEPSVETGEGPPAGGGLCPAYFRGAAEYEVETLSYHIDAFHGIAGFDNPGEAVRVMAKLVSRLGTRGRFCPPGAPILVHEPDQGHFPVWLINYLEKTDPGIRPITLSGRNVLALEGARHNLRAALGGFGTAGGEIRLVAALDPGLNREALGPREGLYRLIALFPSFVPGTERGAAYWEGLTRLLEAGGAALIALPSSEAQGFDRKKPARFVRLGDIKRRGFRALAYQYQGSSPSAYQ